MRVPLAKPVGLGAVPDMSWLKAELLAWAIDRGLPVVESMTKAEILAVISAAS